MNMMPMGAMGGMAPAAPLPPPSPEEIEQAQLILDACTWEEISGILRSDDRRNYSIDVETDATAFEDEETEKQQRIEFMGAMTTWLSSAIPAVQQNPQLAPLMKELTMFSVGAFKVARSLEEAFEDAFEQAKQMQPQPNPEQQKLEMEAKAKEAEFAMKQKDREQDMVFKQKDHELKERGHMADLAYKQKELGFKEQELGFKQREMEMKEASEAFKMHISQQQHQDDRETAMIERQAAQEDREFDQELKERDAAGKEQERAAKAMGTVASASGSGTPKAANMGSFLQGLAKQVSQAVSEQMSEQQMMIAKALQGIAQQQEETTEALTAVVGHITAPVNVKRDPRTRRAIGVERGQNSETDLRAMLEKLAKGRQLVRGADNRIEAFN